MKQFMVVAAAVCLITTFSATGEALTFKKGEVLGADGQIYEGASPELRERLIEQAKKSGKAAGVNGSNLFVVVKDTITFVPIKEIAGKSDEAVEEIVVGAVTETILEAAASGQFAAALSEEARGLAEEAAEAASEEEIDAALEEIAASDVAGIAAAEAAEITKEAWGSISASDLQEATQYATEFAAQQAAEIARSQEIGAALDELQASGASQAEIDAFMEANPPPE